MIEEVIDESKTLHGKVYQELRRLAKENRELKDKLNNRLNEIDLLNIRIRNLTLKERTPNVEKTKIYDNLQSMITYLAQQAEKFR